jgi:hypothetical protein
MILKNYKRNHMSKWKSLLLLMKKDKCKQIKELNNCKVKIVNYHKELHHHLKIIQKHQLCNKED